MPFQNYKKYDMLECLIESNNNGAIASDTYYIRHPERRQPHESIFVRIKKNLNNDRTSKNSVNQCNS